MLDCFGCDFDCENYVSFILFNFFSLDLISLQYSLIHCTTLNFPWNIKKTPDPTMQKQYFLQDFKLSVLVADCFPVTTDASGFNKNSQQSSNAPRRGRINSNNKFKLQLFALMTKIFLIFAAMLWSIYPKEIRLVCLTTSTMDCGSGFKFRVRGTDLDVNYCLPEGESCEPGFQNVIQTSKCTLDYKQSPCSLGVCYFSMNQSTCTKDFGTCSSTPVLYTYECVDCSIHNCTKCFIGYRNGALNTAQICLGESCNQIKEVNATVQSCPNSTDAFGFKCDCCGSTDINVSMCASNNPALSLTTVLDWAKGIIPPNNNSTNSSTGNSTNINSTTSNVNWQLKLHAWVTVLLVLAILMF